MSRIYWIVLVIVAILLVSIYVYNEYFVPNVTYYYASQCPTDGYFDRSWQAAKILLEKGGIKVREENVPIESGSTCLSYPAIVYRKGRNKQVGNPITKTDRIPALLSALLKDRMDLYNLYEPPAPLVVPVPTAPVLVQV
nr:hypothetical protein K-LCC10_0392 [Kaumoebavirus]